MADDEKPEVKTEGMDETKPEAEVEPAAESAVKSELPSDESLKTDVINILTAVRALALAAVHEAKACPGVALTVCVPLCAGQPGGDHEKDCAPKARGETRFVALHGPRLAFGWQVLCASDVLTWYIACRAG